MPNNIAITTKSILNKLKNLLSLLIEWGIIGDIFIGRNCVKNISRIKYITSGYLDSRKKQQTMNILSNDPKWNHKTVGNTSSL